MRRCVLLALLVWGCQTPPTASQPLAMQPPATQAPREVPTPLPPSAAGTLSAPLSSSAKPSEVSATPSPRVSFLLAGDMLLSRNVSRAMQAAGDPLWPFRFLGPLFDSVDFCFANLEAPAPPADRFDPAQLDAIAARGFAVLSLANNHAMDGGPAGLARTLAALRQHGIATTGAGASAEEAWRPAVIERGGLRIAFVAASYTSVNSSRAPWRSEIARIQDVITARQAIIEAGREADFVVAAMHAGVEYVRHPAAEQRRFAHLAVDAGADLVVGSHPHVVQPVEQYRGVYIFHSLGNFIFDQSKPEDVRHAAMVKVTLRRADEGSADAGGAVIERLEVVLITNPDMVSPQLADEASAKRTLQRMKLKAAVLVP